MINISIPSTFEAFVQDAVESGRYESAAALVAEAISLLEQRDRLARAARAGFEQLDRGEYTEYGEDSFEEFARDIAAEERARYGQERQ